MRRLFVLGVLLMVMLGLNALKVDPIGAGDPLTLAAIGFVVLAAFTIAEVGSSFGLPRVTGYILAGVLLGPSVADILSAPVVADMRMFNTLALGLIATTAGLELDIGQIRRLWRTLTATIALKVGLSLLFVGGAFVAMQAVFSPLEINVSGGTGALALIFSALAIGTSPAIVLAVMTELRAKGRLSDLVLGAAVAKDVVVVVAMAIALAIGRSLIAPDADFDIDVLVHVAKEIGASVLAGAILGGLLIAYIRYVHVEMLIFVAAMILVVSELATALHLELLLVFIVAGFVVRNLSEYEHELMKPLEMVALPIFVVFFTIAGAGIDLGVTWQILPLAVVLAGARWAAFAVAARFGGRMGGESAEIQKQAVWAYLPQAGVTLGLVGVAAQRLPELAEPIQATGIGVVALHLLLGPVTLRRALTTVGDAAAPEVSSPPAAGSVEAVEADVVAPAEPPAGIHPSGREDRARQIATVCTELDDPELVALLRNLHDDLMAVAWRVADEQWAPWARATTRSACSALPGGDDTAALRAWTQQAHGDSVTRFAEISRRTFDDMRARLRNLPVEIAAPLSAADLYAGPRDNAVTRARKLSLRLRRRWWARPDNRRRRVPVRLAARMALEPELAAWSVDVLAAWSRAQAGVFERLRLFAIGALTDDEARRAIQQELGLFRDRSLQDAEHVLTRGLCELGSVLQKAGGPRMPRDQVRFSRVEIRVRDSLRALNEEPDQWRARLHAAQNNLRLVVELGALRTLAVRAIEQHLAAPSAEALGGARQVVIGVRAGLARVAEASAVLDADASDDLDARREQLEAGQALFPVRTARQIDQRVARYRARASVHRVAVALRKAVADLPGKLELTHPNTPAHQADRPKDVSTWSMDLQQVATARVLHVLLPAIDERVHTTNQLLANVAPRLREAVDIAIFALESRVEAADPAADELVGLDAAMERASKRLDRLDREVGEASEMLRGQWISDIDHAVVSLQAEISGRDLATLAFDGSSTPYSRLVNVVLEAARPARQWWTRERERTAVSLRRVLSSRLSQELRVRYAGERLDAASLREVTQRWTLSDDLPQSYAAHFSLQPVRDHRLFTAHRDQLGALVEAERAWMLGGPASALIVGEAGSGRTSLLNLVQLDLSVPRVVRPAPLSGWRDTGVLAALALELGCRPQRSAVVNALRKVRTAVLLDDLERWVTPDVDGLRTLTSVLDLVTQTRESVFWLVAAGTPALRTLETVLPLRQAFGHVVELPPLTPAELMEAIEARHALSNRELRFPQTLTGRVFGRIEHVSHRTVFSRLLAATSHGNLTHALTLWKRAVHIDPEGVVHPSLQRTLSVGLPSLSWLHPVEIAMLVHTLRFRSATPKDLAAAVGQPLHGVQRHLGFLRTAGLLAPTDARQEEVEVPRALLSPLGQGLRDMGVAS